MRMDSVRFGYTARTQLPETVVPEAEKAEETLQGASAEERSPLETFIEGEETADSLYVSEEAKAVFDRRVSDLFNGETSEPEDSSSELTKRLVAASGQFEVRDILSAANKAWVQLKMIAGSGGDKAKTAAAYVKKIEKVMKRARRKIEDLNDEDQLKVQQQRAEQQKKVQRAAEIKEELRRELQKRRDRENGYLLEDILDRTAAAQKNGRIDTATEAQIAAKAEAMAAAEIAAESVGGGADGAVDAGMPGDVASGGSSEIGGEVVVDGGGDIAI